MRGFSLLPMKIKSHFLPLEIEISRKKNAPERKLVKVNRDYNKIFCIGFNKTGTTSLEKLLKLFGFTLGNQAAAEVLLEDWTKYKNADRLIRYCHSADAFQDVPFMFPELYKELDRAFPNSKFILTVRDSADQWLRSLKTFHAKKFAAQKDRTPTEEELKNATYRYKGFMFDLAVALWDYPQIPLYDDEQYKAKYLNHIKEVTEYFKGTNRLIQLNVSSKDDFGALCHFLNVEAEIKEFPWENKT